MERIVLLRIAKLPEWGYLAAYKNIQALLAQELTVSAPVEIARDVARKLFQLQRDGAPTQELGV